MIGALESPLRDQVWSVDRRRDSYFDWVRSETASVTSVQMCVALACDGRDSTRVIDCRKTSAIAFAVNPPSFDLVLHYLVPFTFMTLSGKMEHRIANSR